MQMLLQQHQAQIQFLMKNQNNQIKKQPLEEEKVPASDGNQIGQ